MLNTVGHDKTEEQKLFKSCMLADLEVSDLKESAYIQLPKSSHIRVFLYSLLQGPDLTNTLIGVLQRFQKEPLPLVLLADIESMFYQVKVTNKVADLFW